MMQGLGSKKKDPQSRMDRVSEDMPQVRLNYKDQHVCVSKQQQQQQQLLNVI